jgi:hypothetical protein
MSESFVKAREIFDRVMEESLAKYNPGGELVSRRMVMSTFT